MCRDGLLTFSVRFREEREKYLSSSSVPSSSPNRYLPDPSLCLEPHNRPHNAQNMSTQNDFHYLRKMLDAPTSLDFVRDAFIYVLAEFVR